METTSASTLDAESIPRPKSSGSRRGETQILAEREWRGRTMKANQRQALLETLKARFERNRGPRRPWDHPEGSLVGLARRGDSCGGSLTRSSLGVWQPVPVQVGGGRMVDSLIRVGPPGVFEIREGYEEL